jgi:hypothetical protein
MLRAMKSSRSALISLLILGGVLALSLTVKSASPPVGSVRCNFYEPGAMNFYQFYDYPQPASYKGAVSTNASGDPATKDANSDKPNTDFTLKWTVLVETAPYKNAPVKESDGYTAVLSSNASGNNIQPINNVSVPLTGSYNTTIGTRDIVYTLNVLRGGVVVTSCSVDTTLSVKWIKPYVAPTPANVSFPAGESSYSIQTSRGTSTASFKFASPIKNITFYQNNISTYIGSNFKNIFWIANRYGGGPLGRWDISDPWDPQGPETIGLSQGGSPYVLGKPQPQEHKGPFSGGAWPHPPSMGFNGGTFNDSNTGEGRFIFASGESFDLSWPERDLRSISPVISVGAGQGVAIGQLLEEKWQDLFLGAYTMDASAAGKFFFFGGGGYDGKTAVRVFDITDLTGSTDRPYLNPVASQPWQNIVELKVISVPGVRNHFLIGRAANTFPITANPRIYVGEINADTGRIVRSNSFVLPIQGIAYSAPWSPSAKIYPGSNIQGTTLGSNAYIFMNENFTRYGPSPLEPGGLKVAAYKFNPTNLTFARKGDILFKDHPDFTYADSADSWNIVNVENGAAAPLIARIKAAKNNSFDAAGAPVQTPTVIDIHVHALKSFLESASVQSVVFDKPDVVFPGEIIKKPITLGQVITISPEQVNLGKASYHIFAKAESDGKVNLYLYRGALLFDGRSAGDPVFAYHEYSATGDESYFMNAGQNLGSSFRGVRSMRVDKVDVSFFTGAPTVFPTDPTDPFPGGGGPIGTTTNPNIPPPPAGGACGGGYSALCDQLDQLKRLVCKLNPSIDFCASLAP